MNYNVGLYFIDRFSGNLCDFVWILKMLIAITITNLQWYALFWKVVIIITFFQWSEKQLGRLDTTGSCFNIVVGVCCWQKLINKNIWHRIINTIAVHNIYARLAHVDYISREMKTHLKLTCKVLNKIISRYIRLCGSSSL